METDVRNVTYAGFWRRGAAATIDGGVCCVVFFCLDKFLPYMTATISYWAVITLYYIWSETASPRATLGKKLMGIWTGSVSKERMTISTALSRYFIWMLPLIPACLLMLTPTFTEELMPLSTAMETMSDSDIDAYFADPAHRHLLSAFVIFFILFAGGLILSVFLYVLPIAFTKQKIGLHDLLTKTRVYYGPIPADAAKEGASYAVT